MNKSQILDILEELKVENVQPFSRNVQCSCPLADWRSGHSIGSTHAGSLGISIDPEGASQINCFACGFGGTMESLVQSLSWYSKKNYGPLIQKIQKIEDQDLDVLIDGLGDYDVQMDLFEEVAVDESELGQFQPGAHQYLLERGLKASTLKAWECYVDKKRSRSVLPVRSLEKKLVGAVGRTVTGHEIKYFNYFDFEKSQYLFGEHMRGPGSTLVIVEGLLDTLAVWQTLSESGMLQYISVMGLLGARASERQCKKIVRYADEVILFLDNDPTGWTGQLGLSKQLMDQVLLKTIRYPDPVDGDPMSLVQGEVDIQELISTAGLLGGRLPDYRG